MARSYSILAFPLLLAFCSCRDNALAPGHYALTVQTDQAAYALATDSSAHLTISNGSDRPVFLPMECWVVCERLVDGQWVDPVAWITADGVVPYIRLAPGGSFSDQLRLWAYLGGQPGIYRVQYFVYTDPEMHHLLPLEERISAPFTLTP